MSDDHHQQQQQQHKVHAREVDRLESFIRERGPDKTYLIDGDRDDDRSTICRRDGRSEPATVSHNNSSAAAAAAGTRDGGAGAKKSADSPLSAAAAAGTAPGGGGGSAAAMATRRMTESERQEGSVECLKLRMASTRLFAEMQRLGYFCILPQGMCRTLLVHQESYDRASAWSGEVSSRDAALFRDSKVAGRPLSRAEGTAELTRDMIETTRSEMECRKI